MRIEKKVFDYVRKYLQPLELAVVYDPDKLLGTSAFTVHRA